MGAERCEYCQEQPRGGHSHLVIAMKGVEVRSPPIPSLAAWTQFLETMKSPGPAVGWGLISPETGRILAAVWRENRTLELEIGRLNLPQTAGGFDLGRFLAELNLKVSGARSPAPSGQPLPPGYPFTRLVG